MELSYEVVTHDNLPRVRARLHQATGPVALDVETTGLQPYDPAQALLSVAVCPAPGEAYCLPVGITGASLPVEELRDTLRPLLSKKLLGHNIKFDLHWLWTKLAVGPAQEVRDTLVLHHLLDENLPHDLKSLACAYTPIGYQLKQWQEEVDVKHLDADVNLRGLVNYNCGDADATFRLFTAEAGAIKREGLLELARIQSDLVRALCDVEREGFTVDLGRREILRAETEQHLAELTHILKRTTRPDLNLNSPKQLAQLLYREFKLPATVETETGEPSTSEEALHKLIQDGRTPPAAQQWLQTFLEYREAAKLGSTYLGIQVGDTKRKKKPVIMPDGKIHCNYKQTGTVTGRLSCTDPNLQQIPRQGAIKQIFVPSSPDRSLVQADYNQLELRILAHYTQDPGLLNGFESGRDIHRVVAARVFRKPEHKISEEERALTKQVNFGLIYGISPYGLARRMRIPEDRAEQIINQWFSEFSWVRPWLEQVKREAKGRGYVQNEFGRKRRLDFDRNPDVNGLLRQAINAPIQSLASDITMLSTLTLWTELSRSYPDTRIVATVHDSVVVDCPKENVEKVSQLIKEVFEHPPVKFPLNCPLAVDVKAGSNWGELHAIAH